MIWWSPPFDRTSNVPLLGLVGEILERFLLRLWEEQRRQDAGQHDKGKHFQTGFKMRSEGTV